MKTTLFFTTILILLAGCSTVETLPSNSVDLIHVASSREEAEEYWVVSNLVAPRYPVSAVKGKVAGCSRYQITIDATGKTINSVLLESYPSNVFVTASNEALDNWTWKPTAYNQNRTPITRTVQLDFYMEDAWNYEQAKEHCGVQTQL